jgi:DNA-directed RNA polymerase specialized sigma24 family protein
MTKRVRARLRWVPVWEGACRGWTIKFIYKNQWRCDATEEAADLLQDAYLVFMKVCEWYPDVRGPAHFMRLYQTALRNRFHDKARTLRRKNQFIEELKAISNEQVAYNHGYLNLLLEEVPELKLVLELLDKHPDALRSCENYRENLNMKLRRILGVRSNFDFTQELKALLS